MDQHAGGKWLIHDTKRENENINMNNDKKKGGGGGGGGGGTVYF